MRDDDDGKPTPDSDRAAILARRKQFIALALSGLAGTACTDADEPKRKPTPAERESSAQPCLSVEVTPPPEEPYVPPPASETGQAPTGETGESPAGETGETGEAEVEQPPPPKPKPEGKPRPCLRKAAPSPCLKVKDSL